MGIGDRFNLANIGNGWVDGEVRPQRMHELLRDRWSMGPRLTKLCVGAYGGHIHYTAMAISKLSLRK